METFLFFLMSAWFANPFVNWFAISNIKSAHINIATSLSQQILQLELQIEHFHFRNEKYHFIRKSIFK